MTDPIIHHYDTLDEMLDDVDSYPDSVAGFRAPADGHPEITVTAWPSAMVSTDSGVASRGWLLRAATDAGQVFTVRRPDDWRQAAEQAVVAVTAAQGVERPACLRVVSEAAVLVRAAQAEVEWALGVRDQAVRDALASGATQAEVAGAAGVSRQIVARVASR